MTAFLNPHSNGPSLTGIIDVTAHSTSVFQEDELPKHINGIFIPSSGISTAVPYDVQIGELCNNAITMYQFIGDIKDTKVGCLESLLSYENENIYTKDNPSINQHSYHTTKKQHNEETNNNYNIYKNKTLNIKNNKFLTEQYSNKKQKVNNSIINNITKNTINNTGDILNVKKDYLYKTYASNNYKSQVGYVGSNLYKRYDNRTFNNTNTIYKHISQYSTDVFDNSKINKTHNVKNTYYNCTNDVAINKHNTINANDTYIISKTNNTFNTTDNQYFTKKINNTSNTPNNITRHNHNNYERNVIF